MQETDLFARPVHDYFNHDKRKLWHSVLHHRGIHSDNETLQRIEALSLAELYVIAILHDTSFVDDITIPQADAAMYALRTNLAKGVDDPFDNELFVANSQ